MKLRIVDDGGMKYPQVVNADTGEAVDGVISIEYSATSHGRLATIVLISGTTLVADFKGVEPSE